MEPANASDALNAAGVRRDIEVHAGTSQTSSEAGIAMRKALVIGIDHYAHVPSLFGCTADAEAVRGVLARHADGTVNFDVRLLIDGTAGGVRRREMRDAIRQLFCTTCEIALLYFAGHGHADEAGGYILPSDSVSGEEGIPLNEVLAFANQSGAENRVIILDSCHSGIAGSPVERNRAEIVEGITILTASGTEQYASELDGAGLFTTLLVDALRGAAANLVGQVTPGAVYAHIDQSLGAWEQRPVFKTNVKRFVSLRQIAPPLDVDELRRLSELFPSEAYEFALDPSFEPEGPNPDASNVERFRILQKYNRVNLLVPLRATHMYHAAMQSKGCKLTALGEHYRRLCLRGRI